MKYVYIECRQSDPEHFSGIFKVKAKYVFHKKGADEVEYLLEDNRIIRTKKYGNRTRFLTFKPDGARYRNHKITDLIEGTRDLAIAHG